MHVTGTLYWYGTPGIVAESDLAGNLKSEYVFFAGKRVARIDLPAGSVHYYLSDHLNSTTMVVSPTGIPEEESDYSPYGTEFAATSPGPNHYKFTGKERDTESCSAGACLDYFGARYYSSGIGRFMTPDWSDEPDMIPYAELDDPQSLNLYSFAKNAPITLLDPDGHFAPGCGLSPKECEKPKDPPEESELCHFCVDPVIFILSHLFPHTFGPIYQKKIPPPPPSNTPQTPQSTPADPNQQKPQYEPNPKHGPEKKGNVSAAPKDGQTALDNSVQVKDTSPRRVGVDPPNNQIVVLDQTTASNQNGPAVFHGHVRAWNELTPDMQNALKNANLTDARGNIIMGK